jgi:hypothetical protein
MTGVVSAADLREHFEIVRRAGHHSIPELIDARTATVGFGTRDMLRLADFGQQTFAGVAMAPRAMVVRGVIYFGMARLFASMTGQWVRISVFDNMAAAEAWLSAVSITP